MDGYKENNTLLWKFKLKNYMVQETMDGLIQSHIINYVTYHHINMTIPDNNMEEMMDFLQKAIFVSYTSTLYRSV